MPFRSNCRDISSKAPDCCILFFSRRIKGWNSPGFRPKELEHYVRTATTLLRDNLTSKNYVVGTGALLSPSPTPTPVFSRWSTSLLNSAGSSPANSARSSFNHRQPYLGWRSQERLANPRTPAERLAQGILPQLQHANKVRPRRSWS